MAGLKNDLFITFQLIKMWKLQDQSLCLTEQIQTPECVLKGLTCVCYLFWFVFWRLPGAFLVDKSRCINRSLYGSTSMKPLVFSQQKQVWETIVFKTRAKAQVVCELQRKLKMCKWLRCDDLCGDTLLACCCTLNNKLTLAVAFTTGSIGSLQLCFTFITSTLNPGNVLIFQEKLTVGLWLAKENSAGSGMIWGIVFHGKVWIMREEEEDQS